MRGIGNKEQKTKNKEHFQRTVTFFNALTNNKPTG
jgi:hypothetical protein